MIKPTEKATDKETLRRQMRQKRDGYDRGLLREAGARIYRRLMADANVRNARVVMTYVSMGSEADTHALIRSLLACGKAVAVPVVNGKTLDVSYISAMDDLEQGSYEILEPKKAAFRRCEPSEPDVVIVPAIAFDPSGHRIGYGAGFYDRLLPQTNAVKIGIGYSFCMVESAFPEAHDVPADYVITD